MSKIVCIGCDGRQVAWRRGVLVDCPRCLGRGWLTMPSAMADASLWRQALLVIGLTIAAVVGSIVWLG